MATLSGCDPSTRVSARDWLVQLRAALGPDAEPPGVYATPGGEVTAEWRRGSRSLTLFLWPGDVWCVRTDLTKNGLQTDDGTVAHAAEVTPHYAWLRQAKA